MLPFDHERPKSTVFVGANGSGKSILLSHIVNGLLLAKQHTYPGSPEVEIDKVYKLRSPQYIALGKDFYCARVDYTNSLWIGELQLNRQKQVFGEPPAGIDNADMKTLWDNMEETEANHLSTMSLFEHTGLKNNFSDNCILYFPPDRYEDPAWLNEMNLLSKASHLNLSHLEGHTDRKIINYSPLQENQDWLFELAYDFSVFELQTSPVFVNFNRDGNSPQGRTLSVFQGYSGKSKTLFDLVLQVMGLLLEKDDDLRLSIGPRHDRRLSVMVGDQRLIPNIFQLSSGEISLLNLFLTILRDFDL
ncbi:MAG: hypothetical protein F4Z28_10750, partial [Gammaproteobacteria bacterium]|nr:hypothetical protein [Gammaproteobacteria bacterium]